MSQLLEVGNGDAITHQIVMISWTPRSDFLEPVINLIIHRCLFSGLIDDLNGDLVSDQIIFKKKNISLICPSLRSSKRSAAVDLIMIHIG